MLTRESVMSFPIDVGISMWPCVCQWWGNTE